MTNERAAPRPTSSTLTYERLTQDDVGAFVGLAQDAHIRRFLLDDMLVDDAWCAAAIEASDALFDEFGVGLWLVLDDDAPVGFGGFHRFASLHPAPQLLYALLPTHVGRGLATEMAQAFVRVVADHPAFAVVHAAVDAPNVASVRVLHKVGFDLVEERRDEEGAVTLLFEHSRRG